MNETLAIRCPHCTGLVPLQGDWSQGATVRECANQYCSQKFDVDTQNRQKRYCSINCGRAARRLNAYYARKDVA